MTDVAPEDDDTLDGCELDFTEDPDDEETQALRPLFPDGDPSTEDQWHALRALGAFDES